MVVIPSAAYNCTIKPIPTVPDSIGLAVLVIPSLFINPKSVDASNRIVGTTKDAFV